MLLLLLLLFITIVKIQYEKVSLKTLYTQTCPTRRANIKMPRDHQSDACPYGCILATSGADKHTSSIQQLDYKEPSWSYSASDSLV